MTTAELIQELDTRFGNPNAPSQYKTIALAVAELQRLLDENEQLRKAK
jgi:hypothetical protein